MYSVHSSMILIGKISEINHHIFLVAFLHLPLQLLVLVHKGWPHFLQGRQSGLVSFQLNLNINDDQVQVNFFVLFWFPLIQLSYFLQ